MKGVDFGWGKVSGKTLKENDIDFVCRYLSHSPGKNLTSAEIADFREHNLRIVLVWETTEKRPMSGYDGGLEDARYARKLVSDLGLMQMFGNVPVIYYAVDFDADNDDLVAIDQYFKGVEDGTRGRGIGVYGGAKVVKYCLDNKLVQYAWQTSAWSHGKWDERANIRQVSYNTVLDKVKCDLNLAMTDDFGQI